MSERSEVHPPFEAPAKETTAIIIELQLQARYHTLSDSHSLGARVNSLTFDGLAPISNRLFARDLEILALDAEDPAALLRGLLGETMPRWLGAVHRASPF